MRATTKLSWQRVSAVRGRRTPLSHQLPARGKRNAAISWALRTSRRSPTSTGWFQVLPSIAGNRIDQRQIALFRQHQQQILVGQQDELAAAVQTVFIEPIS